MKENNMIALFICHFDRKILTRRKLFFTVNIVHFLFIIGILEMVKQQKKSMGIT